ncbi:MAG: hypothetical protein RIT27_2146 [Pseudomonadota bacterium]|jgi:Cu(I)/Ag(I) efflux system membrane protein CusA/SilA
MINILIRWSISNRFLILIATLLLTGWGVFSLQQTALDALPDLSDVQVIIRTSYAGQSPKIVEDQITYPIATTMLSVPAAQAVRGYSMFGDSYVYVIFKDGTDLYWARSRVLEYLNQVASSLPQNVQPRLGPDATGVGWIYSYALIDKTNQHDLSQLRTLQDWFLRFELKTVSGVAEIATIGGMVKQYQIQFDPLKLRAYNLPLAQVINAVKNANQETGGSVIELAEAEYMIRSRGYLSSISDIEQIPIATNDRLTPILLKDIAHVQIGPEMRRAVADLDGQGETTGGIVVMRYGENALTTIDAVKNKLKQLQKSLPEGVEIIETYDRSALILRAVDNLKEKLIEEFIVVALVCVIFLFHLRSALVAIITLPLGILMAFILMKYQGINANIMSLGGIAIAIGAMVDAAIVMIENAHKHLEKAPPNLSSKEHWKLIIKSSEQVGAALFFSLLIITLSFVPVFSLEQQEGRLFAPLAFTKSYAMAAAALLAITLIPVLMGYFIRGKIPHENANPLNRFLIWIYKPLIKIVLRFPKTILFLAFLVFSTLVIPLYGLSGIFEPFKWLSQGFSQTQLTDKITTLQTHFSQFLKQTPLAGWVDGLGSEFMPQLYEGDLLYMPTTLPSISIGKAQELLQQTDRLIKTLPEIKGVFGKIGRAESATDPAPLNMVETVIQLKPETEWREGMTVDKLIQELDKTVKIPGVTNAWVMPIKTRIDMLATGIKTPVGIKVAGADLGVIEEIGRNIEKALIGIEGTVSAYSQRVTGGRYIDIIPNRVAAARLGLSINEINEWVSIAIGGENISQTIEGRERYPINLRLPRELRDDVEKLKEIPIVTPSGAQVALGQIAELKITDGAPMIQSENARLNGWIFVDIRGVDLGSYVKNAQRVVHEKVKLPTGYSITWSGQYEYLLRVQHKLFQVVPLTLAIIFILLYLTFGNIWEALLVMLSLPFALVGGFWLIYILDYHFSVAVAVGFIALAGVSAEFGVVMLIYLNNALKEHTVKTVEDLHVAIIDGAVLRVRPKAMTVAVIIAGLIPIMFSHGTGSEIMQRIAAPMIGGMLTAPLLSLFVIPAIYLLWKRRTLF